MSKTVFLGVEGSGKTSLTVALAQAFENHKKEGWYLKPLSRDSFRFLKTLPDTRDGNFPSQTADLRELAKARGASVSAVTASNWLQTISDERVKELYMEGFRLNDLKRWVNLSEWNKGSDLAFKRTVQASSQTGTSSTLQIRKNDHRLVWPIPQHEIEAPGSCMKGQQNRGY